MRMYEIIEKKRDGMELSTREIRHFISGYCSGTVPDYQAAALLMAIFLKGMNKRETADLTEIMAASGDTTDLSGISGIKVDKHSTGGVGDKTTLILAPVVAACGVPVAKMSGRGLGHTGGTIDKLESIPGFKTALSINEFISNIKDIGIAISGQTGNLAPADKKLYALRDVTATVNSIPLIASSIMSKKIASGADRIVLDVKVGSGAFMKTLEEAVELAGAMVDIGRKVGRTTSAVITDMDVPLGNAVGNSLEVMEAMDTLKGNGPEDLEAVSLELAARMLELAGIGDRDTCIKKAREVIENGRALAKMEAMIEKQGGDPGITRNYSLFKKARLEYSFNAEKAGYIESVKTDSLGIASVLLGAGRETKDSLVDYSAGLIVVKKPGMWVEKGETIVKLHTDFESRLNDAVSVLKESITISDRRTSLRPLILADISCSGNVTVY